MFWNQTRLTPQRLNHVMLELHLENPGFLKTHCNIPLGLTGQNFFKTKHFFLFVYVQEKMIPA
jgi:hypothetical protein